jgi:hypothetical protein
MRWPLVWRSRHDAELAAAKAEADRQRACRDRITEERDAYRAAAKTSARQFAEADADNTRLAGRNTELTKRLNDSADAAHMAALERRVQHPEQQLDEACGLNDPAVEAGRHWQGKPIVKEPTS